MSSKLVWITSKTCSNINAIMWSDLWWWWWWMIMMIKWATICKKNNVNDWDGIYNANEDESFPQHVWSHFCCQIILLVVRVLLELLLQSLWRLLLLLLLWYEWQSSCGWWRCRSVSRAHVRRTVSSVSSAALNTFLGDAYLRHLRLRHSLHVLGMLCLVFTASTETSK